MSRRPTVQVRSEDITLPTYLPLAPDKNPMFLEKRVYQGSSGKVYPLPFTDRIAETARDRKWRAIRLENQFLRVLVLPELGGRIHAIQDKTNGYDLIYRQPVIKPALVGLAGPWISGGIEFNWPQHHRPATFLPVDVRIEEHADGSKTVWCSDHDPMCRMKGMHGICLHPGKSCVELKVRAHNRTPFVQTFLWWANVATRVHEGYQSFFPPDIRAVADHARRATSEYPHCRGFYYGVNYGERGRHGIPSGEVPAQFVPPHCRPAKRDPRIPDYAPNDLSFYANIPTPCSYMCLGSKGGFFGGYDHLAGAGIVHVANPRISPGKKQWTWGNQEFGYAWDRNLTDGDKKGEFGPYIELMAGVYTDNQPDFSFLQPGETKTWSQFWYPIRKIGPAQQANLDAAVSLRLAGGFARCGISVTKPLPATAIVLTARGKELISTTRALAPGKPFLAEVKLPNGVRETDVALRVTDRRGREIISYTPERRSSVAVPPAATEPPPPADIAGNDELFLIGLHLEQYRHATRCPALYWREALRRDPLDSRCNNAMGLWHLRRGEFTTAEPHLRKAIERLTGRNPNPYDSEPYYNLGLCLRFLGREAEAYDALYKACWNQAWQSAGHHALAELDCKNSNWPTALDHLERSLRLNVGNLRARNLKVMVLRKLAGAGVQASARPGSTISPGKLKLELQQEASSLLRGTLALDPLDWWARYLAGEMLRCDLQTRLDLAHDFARAGFYTDAIAILSKPTPRKRDLPDQSWGAEPLVHYTLGWLHLQLADQSPAKSVLHRQHKVGTALRRNRLQLTAASCFRRASTVSPDYCFPARLEEIAIFEAAMAKNPEDSRAPYYLGNLFYDRRRHAEAIKLWERSARIDPDFSIVWRNLGIGYFNIRHEPSQARRAYNRAFPADPGDARLLFERDQLWKRLGDSPVKRLRELEKHPHLVNQRDDLRVELCALYNQTGQPARALRILSTRKFQPWEGGEGQALGQHVRTHLALGRRALACPDFRRAANHFETALTAPDNLGEAKHLLANQSDIHYWLGVALDSLGEKESARTHWFVAATFEGDFQEMSTRTFSEMTYYSALAWQRLGQPAKAKKLLRAVLANARKLGKAPAGIDYFATSLPTMLLFDDDMAHRQKTTSLFLQAQAFLGLGRLRRARALLTAVLRRDPNHAPAADLLREFAHRNEKS